MQNIGRLYGRFIGRFGMGWTLNGVKSLVSESLPYVVNLRDKVRFEALGCPVDTTELAVMRPPYGKLADRGTAFLTR